MIQQIASIQVSETDFLANAEKFLELEYGVKTCSVNVKLVRGPIVAATWLQQGETSNDYDWLIGGDAPFLSIQGDAADSPEEAIAVYALELRHWTSNTGLGRKDSRQVRDPRDWRVIERLTPEWQHYASPRETYLIFRLLPELAERIQRADIRAECRRIGVEGFV